MTALEELVRLTPKEKAEKVRKLQRREDKILVGWLLKLLILVVTAWLISLRLTETELIQPLALLLLAIIVAIDGGRREDKMLEIDRQISFLSH